MELLRVVDNNGNDTNEILEREELHNRGKLHNEVTIYIIKKKYYYKEEVKIEDSVLICLELLQDM